MEDGCSPHRARAKARKNCVDFDEIDEFSNDQTKMGFHESLCPGPHEFVSFLYLFLFILLSHVSSSLVWEGKKECERGKIGVFY